MARSSFCPACRGFVNEVEGFCLVGHKLPVRYRVPAPRSRNNPLPALKGAVVALVFYLGVASAFLFVRETRASKVSNLAAIAALQLAQAEGRTAGGTELRPSEPRRVVIPSIGLMADVTSLGLTPARELEVPSDPDETGWYSGGPRPGERGPAVIVGHVDSRTGPAVFVDLDWLLPGHPVIVEDKRGLIHTFEVTHVIQVPKSKFPTRRVYGNTLAPSLRLITCGGRFGSDGHYAENVIVFAELTRPT